MSATPGNDLPGAFPTDVTAASHDESASHQPNKLHKRNDPRGWDNDGTAPRTEAGSGLTGSHARDPSLSAQPGDYTYGSQAEPETGSALPTSTGAQDRIHNQGHTAPTETAGQPAQDSVSTIKRDDISSGAAGLATGHGTSSALGSDNHKATSASDETGEAGHNVVRGGLGQKSSLDNEEPYWGDIPRGAGTYNTVVGHGSAEDKVEGHPQHREFPLSGGAHGHGTHDTTAGTASGSTTHRDSALTHESPTAGQGTYNTVVGHGSQEDPAQVGHSGPTAMSSTTQHEDSHGKEIAAGAGAAGLGGYAAHKYASKDDEPTDQAKTSSHHDKDHKHGGLLHREHKDKPSKHENIKHEKEHKDDGDKDRKLFGLFSRSKKDSEHGEHSTTTTDPARSAHDTTATKTTTTATHDENESHLGRNAALAGAGAGAAGYAGHKHAHKDEERDAQRRSKDDDLSRHESGKSESKLHGIFHRSNKEREIPPNAAEYYNGKDASQIAEAKERKGIISPEDRHVYGESSSGPAGAPGTTNVFMGATGAAVAPAAYASHKEHEKHGHSQVTPTATTGAHSSTTQPTSRGTGDQYDHLSSGTASGVGAGATASALSGDNRSSNPGARSQGDQYDHLSSGTASGIGAGTTAGALSGENRSSNPRAGGRSDQYDHLSSGTASGVAAGTTAGALSGDNRSSNLGAHSQGDQYDHLSSGTASGIGAGATTGALSGSKTSSNIGARGQSDPYDHLSSGTASGVRTDTQYPSNNTAASPSSSAYSTDDKHGSNKLAYAGAGAAGAGAAAYGAHKLHDRDGNTTQTTTSSTTNPVSSTQRSAEAPTSSTVGHQPLSSTGAAALGAGAPVSASGARKDESGVHTGERGTGASSRSADLSRSSQDSSKGGQYNVLASGTPSGVNLEQVASHSSSHHDSSQQQQQRSAVHDPLTSSSSHGTDHSKLAATGGAAALAGAGAAGYASTHGGQHGNTPTTTTTNTSSSYDNVISNAPERQVASGTTHSDIHGRNLISGNERQVDNSADPNAGSASYDNKPTAPQGDHSLAAGGAAALAGAGAAGYASTRTGQQESTPATGTNTSSFYDNAIARAPERQAASGTTDSDIHGRNLMSGNERHTDTSTDPNAGSASYANKPTAPQAGGAGIASGGAALAAAQAATRGDTSGNGGPSKPVMHTCTGCGKQDDISSYISAAKEAFRH